jgi:NADH dehydrogenase [ubiquinone] 1 alpha subcomplex assembly factor 7
MSKFGELKSAVSLHLVEVSPKMRALQHERLAGSSVDTVVPVIAAADASGATGGTPGAAGTAGARGATVCQSKYGAPVTWYTRLADVPRAFSIFIAHEFFDALPVHKIQVRLLLRTFFCFFGM